MPGEAAGYGGMGLNDEGIAELRDYLALPSRPGLSNKQAMQAYATIAYLRAELRDARVALAKAGGK